MAIDYKNKRLSAMMVGWFDLFFSICSVGLIINMFYDAAVEIYPNFMNGSLSHENFVEVCIKAFFVTVMVGMHVWSAIQLLLATKDGLDTKTAWTKMTVWWRITRIFLFMKIIITTWNIIEVWVNDVKIYSFLEVLLWFYFYYAVPMAMIHAALEFKNELQFNMRGDLSPHSRAIYMRRLDRNMCSNLCV